MICSFSNCFLQREFAHGSSLGSQEGQRPPLSASRVPYPPRPTSLPASRLVLAELWRHLLQHTALTQTHRRQTPTVLNRPVPTQPPPQIRGGHTAEAARSREYPHFCLRVVRKVYLLSLSSLYSPQNLAVSSTHGRQSVLHVNLPLQPPGSKAGKYQTLFLQVGTLRFREATESA